MPTDLLLPAFAFTLAINAAFVWIAIRAMRAERRSGTTSSRPAPGSQLTASPPPAPTPADGPARVATEPGPEPRDLVAPPSVAEAQPSSRPGAGSRAIADPVAAQPEAASAAAPPPPLPSPTVPETAPSSRSAARTGRRRKFSLPPLEDPEKVTRSIETFLAGTDAPPSPEVPAAADAPPPATPTPVVTVAAIQLLGGSGWEVLERTVRSTARATDVVTVDRRGRVRVVLAGSGELAARAYLRRIRAIVEPVLEAHDPSSRVVIAMATELDGAVATARRRADRRLSVALRTAATTTGGEMDEPGTEDVLDDAEVPEPRAAGDLS